MILILSDHAKARLIQRKFPSNYPELIFNQPDVKYYDNFEKSEISIKSLVYGNEHRLILISYIYDLGLKSVIIKTIHPTGQDQINRYVQNGKWVKRRI